MNIGLCSFFKINNDVQDNRFIMVFVLKQGAMEIFFKDDFI